MLLVVVDVEFLFSVVSRVFREPGTKPCMCVKRGRGIEREGKLVLGRTSGSSYIRRRMQMRVTGSSAFSIGITGLAGLGTESTSTQGAWGERETERDARECNSYKFRPTATKWNRTYTRSMYLISRHKVKHSK